MIGIRDHIGNAGRVGLASIAKNFKITRRYALCRASFQM
jgi:hypothetical protein